MAQRTRTHAMCSALPVGDDGAPLPTEFLMFKPGLNETYNGNFTFDKPAAAAVMAMYERRGVDLKIDLEHDSMNKAARTARADAADAMGWFKPELRPDGSLWATQVRWSAEGERRLRARLQRYTSPTFAYDTESGQILELINCALCSDPATYDNAPLVAATRGKVVRQDLSTGALKEMCNSILARVITRRVTTRK